MGSTRLEKELVAYRQATKPFAPTRKQVLMAGVLSLCFGFISACLYGGVSW